MQKLIYVCTHGEYGNMTDKALRDARLSCHFVHDKGEVPVSPYLLYDGLVSKAIGAMDAAEADRLGLDLLRQCDELWAFGDKLTFFMERDVKEAQRMGMPVRYLDYETAFGAPSRDFAIWVETSEDSLLHGQAGYLFDRGFPLQYSDPDEADFDIRQLLALRMGNDSRAEYRLRLYDDSPMEKALDILQVREMECRLAPNALRNIQYGEPIVYFEPFNGPQTVVELALPEIDKTLWASCTLEGFGVFNENPISVELEDGGIPNLIYSTHLADKGPKQVGQWKDTIAKLLQHQIQEEMKLLGQPAEIPPTWAGLLFNLPPEMVEDMERHDKYYTVLANAPAPVTNEPYILKNQPEWFTEFSVISCELGVPIHWDSGGNGYVTSFKARPHGTDRWMWVSTDGESFSAILADENIGPEFELPDMEKQPLVGFQFDCVTPADVGPWLCLADRALTRHIYEELNQTGGPVRIPAGWIPFDIAEQTDDKYIQWLKENPQETEYQDGLLYVDGYIFQEPQMEGPT